MSLPLSELLRVCGGASGPNEGTVNKDAFGEVAQYELFAVSNAGQFASPAFRSSKFGEPIRAPSVLP